MQWDDLKVLLQEHNPFFTCSPYPPESSCIHCVSHLISSCWQCTADFFNLYSICSCTITENTTKVKLAIVQTNKSVEPKEQTVCCCPTLYCYSFWTPFLRVKSEESHKTSSHIFAHVICIIKMFLPAVQYAVLQCFVTVVH